MKIYLRFFGLLTISVAGFFIFTRAVAAAEVINQDTVWGGDQVIVSDGIQITDGATLTIAPGTIVKMKQGKNIAVDAGRFIARGTAEKPIVITSIKDDTYGGDTNGDGAASSAAPGDWTNFFINNENSSIVIDYARIMYAGSSIMTGPGIFRAIKAKEFSITNSDIINTDGLSQVYTGNFSMQYSNFYNPDFCHAVFGKNYCAPYGFWNNSTSTLDLRNNYWGHPDGPTPTPPDMKGVWIGGIITYEPFLTEPIKHESAAPDPVIVIPGILGSWRNMPWDKWQIDPILHVYDNLIASLEVAGYEKDKTLFLFPYDWRLPNAATAMDLKTLINEVKQRCNCKKVDVVAHSMGGLVARAYVEMGDYEDDIDQLIFLATPHQGSPSAYLTWEAGEIGPSIEDLAMELIFNLQGRENGFKNLFDYVRGYPIKSVEELLPTYDYLQDKSSTTMRIYPNNYPRNLFLELLNNDVALNKLKNIRITNIVADTGNSDTVNFLRVVSGTGSKWEYGYPENYDSMFGDRGLIYGAGDSTVPKRSNDNFNGWSQINFISNHQDIVTDAQKAIVKELTGKEPEKEIKKNLVQKYLVIRIFSPADFKIIAPDGKVIGKDFIANQNINQIADAFYSGFEGNTEFVVIPDPLPGEYKVQLQGTSQGEYRLSIDNIDNNGIAEKEFAGSIDSNQYRTFDFMYSNSGAPIGDLINIDDIINIIESFFADGKLKLGDKTILVNSLRLLKFELQHLDNRIANIDGLITKLTANQKMKPQLKSLALQQLENLKSACIKEREKIIERRLNFVFDRLENMKRRRGVIDQETYQIIKDDLNNLKLIYENGK